MSSIVDCGCGTKSEMNISHSHRSLDMPIPDQEPYPQPTNARSTLRVSPFVLVHSLSLTTCYARFTLVKNIRAY